MKLELLVTCGPNNEYYNIKCLTEGTLEEKEIMSQALDLFWTRLHAGKKSYARLNPVTSEDRDFETLSITLRGAFRLMITDKEGKLEQIDKTIEDGAMIGFGLPWTKGLK